MRSDEALRLLSIGQDIAAERERQRATLAEWAQDMFFGSYLGAGDGHRTLLTESEFGLWVTHRASLLFGESREYDSILRLAARTDEVLAGLPHETPGERTAALRDIKSLIDQISTLLTVLFERLQANHEARDPLTRLLHRRFLHPSISREIAIHESTRRPFSGILFEIDDFAALRASLGEGQTDRLLQQTAGLLLGAARSSDTLFAMRHDTFFVIRVENTAREARRFATTIAERFAAMHLEANGRVVSHLSMRFGVAEFDGHPNPRHFVRRAEEALRDSGVAALQEA